MLVQDVDKIKSVTIKRHKENMRRRGARWKKLKEKVADQVVEKDVKVVLTWTEEIVCD